MTASAEIGYSVTFLEMSVRPSRARPRPPALPGLALMRAEEPPLHFFRYLYDMVGRDYEWTDMHALSDADLAAFLRHEEVSLHVALTHGWPGGFAMLDFRARPTCDVSYFGLAPEAIGRGLGDWLLGETVHMAWDQGAEKLTVNTCSLDHPRALGLYQSWGFAPTRREERRRRVSTDFLTRRPEHAPKP